MKMGEGSPGSVMCGKCRGRAGDAGGVPAQGPDGPAGDGCVACGLRPGSLARGHGAAFYGLRRGLYTSRPLATDHTPCLALSITERSSITGATQQVLPPHCTIRAAPKKCRPLCRHLCRRPAVLPKCHPIQFGAVDSRPSETGVTNSGLPAIGPKYHFDSA